jgi:hypothetical protein
MSVMRTLASHGSAVVSASAAVDPDRSEHQSQKYEAFELWLRYYVMAGMTRLMAEHRSDECNVRSALKINYAKFLTTTFN